MKIEKFEDIEAWQEARKLVKMAYDAINKNEVFLKDFRLVNQIQGAAVSAMANIQSECNERDSNKDAVRFFYLQRAH